MLNQERINFTRQAIIDSFIKLETLKDDSEISVKLIADHAHIDRGTFYRYFESKQALIDYCEDDIIDQLSDVYQFILKKLCREEIQDIANDNIEQILMILENNLTIVNVLLNEVSSNSFYMKLKDFVETLNIIAIEKIHHYPDKQTKLIATFKSSAIVGVISFWCNNPQEYTRQDILKFLDTITQTDVYRNL